MKCKCIIFVSAYSTGKQTGIQACHALAELSIAGSDEYRRWASTDKTIVVLNGGNKESMESIKASLIHYGIDSNFIGEFRESEQNDTLTAVAFIANDRIEVAKTALKQIQRASVHYVKSEIQFSAGVTDAELEFAKFLLKFHSHGG